MKQAIRPSRGSTQLGIVVILPAVAAVHCPSGGEGERLCIPCAVNTPDFKERAPSRTEAPFDNDDGRAWIEGRPFTLVQHPSRARRCTRCGQEVPAVYSLETESDILTAN